MSYQLKLKSVSLEALSLYKIFVQLVLKKMNVEFSIVSLPNTRKRITLLRSPFVNKKSREQFEFKAWNSLICIKSEVTPQQLKIIMFNQPKCIQLTLQQSRK